MQIVLDKINLFVEKYELKFDILCDVENRGLFFFVEENFVYFYFVENKEN